MNLKYIFLIFLLSWISYCAFPECKKTDYTYITFTLTWVSQFCSMPKRHCNSQKKPFVEDGQRPLSIHGFWPSSLDLAYLDCLFKNQKDYFCYTKFPFNKDLFQREDIQLLQEYWPDLQDNKFWKYEWNKHGTCYLNILKQQRKSPLSPEQIFRDYFMGTIEKAKKLNIRLPAATSIPTQEDLADLMNLKPNQFYAICQGRHSLSQIRICYDISNQPKKQKIRTCPISQDNKLCVFPISLKQ